MSLILASGSSIRHKILNDAKIPFECLVGASDEPGPNPEESAEDYVCRAAEAKAMGAWEAHCESRDLSKSMIIGCDQVVRFRGQILRKVKEPEAAIERLLAFGEEDHELVNGLAIVENGEVTVRRHEIVRLRCRALPREQIETYVQREQPFSSVACYFLEGEGIKLIERFEGNFFTALGLPLLTVTELLSEKGIALY